MAATAYFNQHVKVAGSEQATWDVVVLFTTIALLSIGALMVYSASLPVAMQTSGNGFSVVFRHLIHLSIGIVCMITVMHTRVRYWQILGPYLLLIGIALLVLVLIPGFGIHVNGSSRWLNLGLFNMQPSEFVKLFMIIYMAGYLVRRQDQLREFVPGILMISLVVMIIGVLLLQEPDLGSLAVISVTVLAMMFLAGVRFLHFMVIMAAGIGGMIILTMVAPYRMNRIAGFIDPWADPFNTGFQLVQALIAFGRGEWFGVGLGASVQKLSYLPAAHTDFLLAILAEEMGLIGVLTVVILFAVLVFRAMKIAQLAEFAGQIFAARLCQGIAVLLGVQAIINMGVNMGLLPTKGLTLPLMSAGGSSLIVSCISVGFLLLVEREVRTKSWPQKKSR